ncbi:caspase family protein [Bradyrhizobium sp. WSM 1738]|uniref:caspase family protein n=1 Tax=Bradyrhizobium hereditatis TaxID=2821405 RepID=UPI001CE26EE9|nr:caspase family protein [Bradyrhizobium hereditatis]MCA6114103.1 caspase family protein [Bradyrhizobium hereditatis]
MRTVRLLILLICFGCLGCNPALAETRIALVIGNSAYQKVPRLANPTSDAAALAAMFKSAHFDLVELKFDLAATELRRTLREFAARTRDADIAVVYYSGHGIELDGNNFLVPVDAALQTDGDVLDETISLERVLFAVEPARRLRLIILDACRDNPFVNRMRRSLASRGIWRGLAKVEPTTPNTLIAFAAKAGSTASDGDSRHSPFATALVEYLPRPGLDIRRALGYVRDDVLKNTGNKQEPYVYGSLGGDDVPLVPAIAPEVAPQQDPQATVRRDYELALQLATRDGWEAFLSHHPEGFYANLAKGQINKIAAEDARAAAAEKARLADQEKARLAEQGARQAELAKAVAAAKAAEEARIAAEEAKRIAQEKVAAAEAARPEQEKKGEKGNPVAALEQTGALAEKHAEAKVGHQLAALSPPAQQHIPLELTVALQEELRRVGCNTGSVDGTWSAASERSLQLFNIHAGTAFDTRGASADALKAVKSKTGRICPLTCDFGYRAEGSGCRKIICPAGYELNDLGSCKKVQAKRAVGRPDQTKQKLEPAQGAKVGAALPKTQTAEKIFCDSQGCRPLGKGCRLEGGWIAGLKNRNSQYQVCP